MSCNCTFRALDVKEYCEINYCERKVSRAQTKASYFKSRVGRVGSILPEFEFNIC